MASFKNLREDVWKVAIDLKGVRLSKTFTGRGSKATAKAWADVEEGKIQRLAVGLSLEATGTVGDLITRYEKEIWQYKKWGDSKAYNLKKLKDDIGSKPLKSVTKEMIIDYGKKIAATRGPVGTKERLSYLSVVFLTARNLWSIETNVDGVKQAMSALGVLGLVGGGEARTRRVSWKEIDEVKAAAVRFRSAQIDLSGIVDVLALVPLRIGELCRLKWDDFRDSDKSVLIRQRKHPTKKGTNDQWVHLPTIGGIDTYKLITDRPRYMDGPFPYRSTSVSTQFWLAVRRAAIQDFHLHDLRAHAISFMLAFLSPQVVATISGHTNYVTMAKHYARMTPDQVRAAIERSGADKVDARTNLKLVEAA